MPRLSVWAALSLSVSELNWGGRFLVSGGRLELEVWNQ